MDRYAIALKKKPPMAVDAMVRAHELMALSLNDLNHTALGYILFMSKKYGYSAEVLLTCLAHYVQATEGLKTTDKAYKIDAKGKAWFKSPVKADYRKCPSCGKMSLLAYGDGVCSRCPEILPF